MNFDSLFKLKASSVRHNFQRIETTQLIKAFLIHPLDCFYQLGGSDTLSKVQNL